MNVFYGGVAQAQQLSAAGPTAYALNVEPGSYSVSGSDAGLVFLPFFPTESVVDSFTRADQTPPGSAWDGSFAVDGWQVKSNQLVNESGGWDCIYWDATPAADQECYVTLAGIGATSSQLQMHVRKDYGADTGYYANIVVGAGNDTLALWKRVTSTDTQLGSDVTSLNFAAGDSFGISVSGSTIYVWHKPAAGSWTLVMSETDSAITAAGVCAICSNAVGWILDDFGSASAGAVAYELNLVPGSYTLTGAQAAAGRMLNAVPGSYALTGVLQTRNLGLRALPGSYALAGLLATRALATNALPGAYTFTGLQAGLVRGYPLNAAPGVYQVVGFQAGAGLAVNFQPGSYLFTGFAADLVLGVPSAGYELNVEAGSYQLVGIQAGTSAGFSLNALPGIFQIFGHGTIPVGGLTFSLGRVVNAVPGSYMLVGFQAGFPVALRIALDFGVYGITGPNAELVYETAAAPYRITDFATCAEAEAAGWRLEYTFVSGQWVAVFEKYIEPERLAITPLAASPGVWPIRHYGTGATQAAACAHALRSLNSWRDNRYDVQPHPIARTPIGGHTIDVT